MPSVRSEQKTLFVRVTEAAVKLQDEGLIQYKRGGVRIIDRRKLESAACECYQNVRNEFERLFHS